MIIIINSFTSVCFNSGMAYLSAYDEQLGHRGAACRQSIIVGQANATLIK